MQASKTILDLAGHFARRAAAEQQAAGTFPEPDLMGIEESAEYGAFLTEHDEATLDVLRLEMYRLFDLWFRS